MGFSDFAVSTWTIVNRDRELGNCQSPAKENPADVIQRLSPVRALIPDPLPIPCAQKLHLLSVQQDLGNPEHLFKCTLMQTTHLDGS